MKAAVVYGANDIRIAEVTTPKPGPGEVLVRVKGSGVCATDVKILGGSGLPKQLPTILGHEVAGLVEAIGDGVGGLETGQRVAVYPIAACGECFFCERGRHPLCLKPYGLAHGADGGFAEYLLAPKQIVRLGGIVDIGDMPFDMAAMIEPISCCLSAAEQCSTAAGGNVVIIGCGPLGLMHTMVSNAIGAHVIAVDVSEDRLAKAGEIGAEITLNPDQVDVRAEVRKRTAVGADVVIAAVGDAKVVEQYLPLVRAGGVFNIFGGTPKGDMIQLDPRWLHYGEVVLTGTFAASLRHFKQSLEFVRNNADVVSKIISERCALDGVLDAVERVKAGAALKTIIMFE
ncbi:MAG: alcohol dehydrogenase catalytic domain-containing protein [bacterium]|nr:alcohol dehydrogenase catalytic domain-containing protein [bacterium]